MLLALLLVAFAPFLSAPTGWSALHAPSFDAASDNRADERTVLRKAALANRVPYTTTLSAANAACDAIAARRQRDPGVRPLQALLPRPHR